MESNQPEIVETEVGTFEIIKNYKEAYDTKSFIERYVDYFDKYEIIVGDYSAEMLRLKGFNKNAQHKIYDYLNESAVPNAPYFILRRISATSSDNDNDKEDSASNDS